MNIIDISWPINNQITTYKNKADVKIMATATWEQDHKRESRLLAGLHTGTHVDAPSHFLAQGAQIAALELTQICGLAQVLDLGYVTDVITECDLAQFLLNPGEIILLKTRNSLLAADAPFNPEFVYLSAAGAAYLVTKHIKAVGIDYLGIERAQPDHATHIQLFQAQIAVIEGLRLAQVLPGYYQLYCLPLNLMGVEAAPARAILVPLTPA